MNILIRSDSSSKIGTGHIMRDLVLAQKYRKKENNVIFATRNLEGNINFKIIENGYKIQILQNNEINILINLIKEKNIDLLVIDHYAIDYKDEKKIKDETGVKILSLDDTYEKHYCDILLNHNISAKKIKYKNLILKDCELRCGKKYTLIREEFIKEKRKYVKKNKIKKIFVAIGGADYHNINIKILKVLQKVKNFEKIEVNIVTTTANKHLEELKKYCKNKKWIALHINSNKVAKLMRISDLSIVTPSVILNEVMYMGLPFIAIQTASNQKDMVNYLQKKNYTILKKFNDIKLLQKIKIALKGKR